MVFNFVNLVVPLSIQNHKSNHVLMIRLGVYAIESSLGCSIFRNTAEYAWNRRIDSAAFFGAMAIRKSGILDNSIGEADLEKK